MGFLPRDPFPFVGGLEAAWRAIREECLSLPRDTYEPWVQREMYGDGWSVFGLVAFGRRIEGALRACPRTAQALEGVPHLTTAGFSRLAPGTHIQPHVGWVKTVYRGHLGLVVPGETECALRVGRETRPWREGECLVFDDTVEHEAWNRAHSERIVLLFDFARPGCEDAPLDEPPPEVARAIRKLG